MPTPWQRIFRTAAIANALPATAAETIVAQLRVTEVSADAVVDLEGWALLTTGVATTSIVVRVRRDSASGTLVGDQTATTIVGAVGSVGEYGRNVTDTPGDVASLLYVLTIVQTAATGAGTLAAVMLRAIVG